MIITKKWSKVSGRMIVLLLGMTALVAAFGLVLSSCAGEKAEFSTTAIDVSSNC